MDTKKPWYLSKTLWANMIAVTALIAQSIDGSFIISPEIQGSLLAIANLILRVTTKQSLDWSASDGMHEPPSNPGGNAFGFIRFPLLITFLLVSLPFVIAACATHGTTPAMKDTPLQTAGKSLLTVKTTITTAATATDALCKSGTLSADTCAQAKTAYGHAKPAYDAAVDAYLLMASTGGDSAPFGAALLRLQNIARNLILLSGGVQ